MPEGSLKPASPLIWSSAKLGSVDGLRHGFTGRPGGVSAQGPFSGLNLSFRVGDERDAVLKNQARVLRALSFEQPRLITVKQVHGNQVVRVTRRAGKNIEADAIWTTDRGVLIAVLVADCVPIIIADRRSRVVAAVHAGWRGTCAKIGLEMVRTLSEAGFEPSELVAAIGPSIGPERFEVGPEVVEAIDEAYPGVTDVVKRGEGDRFLVDLWKLNQHCLTEAGIALENIDTAGMCTVDSPHFFSYRRDGGLTGRQAGVVGLG